MIKQIKVWVAISLLFGKCFLYAVSLEESLEKAMKHNKEIKSNHLDKSLNKIGLLEAFIANGAPTLSFTHNMKEKDSIQGTSYESVIKSSLGTSSLKGILQAIPDELRKRYTTHRKEQDIILACIESYLTCYKANQLVQAHKTHLLHKQTLFNSLSKQVNLGLKSSLDLLQSKVDLTKARYAYDVVTQRSQNAFVKFNDFFGFRPEGDNVTIPNKKFFAITSIGALQKEAMQHNLEIKALKQLNKLNKMLLSYSLMPIEVNLQLQWPMYKQNLKEERFHQVALEANFGGSQIVQMCKERTKVKKSSIELEKCKEVANLKIHEEYSTLQSCSSKLALAKETLELHEMLLSKKKQEYDMGNTNITELLQVQSDLLVAHSEYIEDVYNYWYSYYTLANVLGKLDFENILGKTFKKTKDCKMQDVGHKSMNIDVADKKATNRVKKVRQKKV